MKNLFTALFLIVACMSAISLKAQTFEEGSHILNVTLGIGNAIYSGSGYHASFPALAASYEIGILDDVIDENGSIGVAGYLGYAAYRWRYRFNRFDWGYNYSNIIIGPRGVFHYEFVDKLDTYAGIMIAANIVSVREKGDVGSTYAAAGSGVIFDTFIGARYYFTENIAGTAELGFGVAYLNIGASFKLK